MEIEMDIIHTLSQLVDHMVRLDLPDAVITADDVAVYASHPEVSHEALLAEATSLVKNCASAGPYTEFDDGYRGTEPWTRLAPGASKIVGYGGAFTSGTGKGLVRWMAYVRADTEALVLFRMKSVPVILPKAA